MCTLYVGILILLFFFKKEKMIVNWITVIAAILRLGSIQNHEHEHNGIMAATGRLNIFHRNLSTLVKLVLIISHKRVLLSDSLS